MQFIPIRVIFKYVFITIFFYINSGNEIAAQGNFVPFNSRNLSYEGRIANTSEASILSWPGNSVSISFKGSSLKALIADTDTADYFNVIVDETVIGKIHPGKDKKEIILVEGLPFTKHTVQLFKRTESDKGNCIFYGFFLDKSSKLIIDKKVKKHTIEFYGDSISCGYGDEHPDGNSGEGFYENNYISFTAITARHFNAHYSCIAKSGIGVTVSWFPLIMPEMYNRVIENDSVHEWDFKRNIPDIVIINLFQNDSWIINLTTNAQYIARFKGIILNDHFFISAYRNLILKIRNEYPKARIICTLGSMDAVKDGSKWVKYILKAKKELHDKKLYVHFFPYKNSGGHPNCLEQLSMGNNLIKFINSNFNW